MSADLMALLQSCKETPEDDVPRQVLADWLDDHGFSDRAACVRRSRRLARLSENDLRHTPWRDELDDPRREAGRWLAPLRQRFPRADFHDGLLRLWLNWDELLAITPDDIPQEFLPWIETLRFTSYISTQTLEEVATTNALRPFTSLDFENGAVEDDELAELFQHHSSKHLAHIVRLNLRDCMLFEEGCEELCRRHAQLPALRHLDLGFNEFEEEAVKTLAASPLLGQLASLDLDANHLNETSAILLNSPSLGQLVELRLGYLGKAEMRALVKSPELLKLRSLELSSWTNSALQPLKDWPANRSLERFVLNSGEKNTGNILRKSALLRSVRELEVRECKLEAAGLRELLAGLPGPRLTCLGLARNFLTDAGTVLAECPALASLRELDLSDCQLTDQDILALARSPYLRGLEVLNLTENTIGPGGFQALTTGTIGGKKALKDAIDPFPHLRVLGLRQTRPTKNGISYLAASRLLSRLEILDLGSNRGQDMAQALADSVHSAGLRHLNLRECHLSDDDAKALAASKHLAGLLSLDLAANNLTNAGLQELALSPGLSGLTALTLGGNHFTNALARTLIDWRPGEWARFNITGNFSEKNDTALQIKGVKWV